MPLWTPGFVDKSKLLAWFKADAITGFADGIGITPWVDSSGNGKNAIQATGINRPLYRTNQINGLPSVQFVSSDSVAPPLSGSLITEGFVCVIKRDATANVDIILDSAAGGRNFYVDTLERLILRAEAGTIIANSGVIAAPTSPMIVGYRLTATTWELNINGTITSGSHAVTFTAGIATTTIGEGPGASNGFEGFISELCFFDGAGATTLEKTTGYLAAKYNLQANLPGGHPYKTTPPLVARSGMVAVV